MSRKDIIFEATDISGNRLRVERFQNAPLATFFIGASRKAVMEHDDLVDLHDALSEYLDEMEAKTP